MVSISGFGQTGPYAQYAGDASTIHAMGGLADLTGEPDAPPTRSGIAVADYLAGIYGALSVVTALYRRQQTGKGQHIDLSLLESLVTALAHPIGQYRVMGKEPTRAGNFSPMSAANGVFRTQDGYLQLDAGPDSQWARLCQAMGRDDLLQDPRLKTRADRLAEKSLVNSTLAQWMVERSTDKAVDDLRATGVNCAPVRTVGQVWEDPQLLTRRFFPQMGGDPSGKVPAIALPFKFSDLPEVQPTMAPAPGEQNAEVYGGWLGLGEDELAVLKEQGVI